MIKDKSGPRVAGQLTDSSSPSNITPATYGKPALHKKRKYRLAFAKAEKVLMGTVPKKQPLSILDKLGQIFGCTVRGDLSSILTANTEQTLVSKEDDRDVNVSAKPGNQPENTTTSDRISLKDELRLDGSPILEPEKYVEFSSLHMGSLAETSTPIKKTALTLRTGDGPKKRPIDVTALNLDSETHRKSSLETPPLGIKEYKSGSPRVAAKKAEKQHEPLETPVGVDTIFQEVLEMLIKGISELTGAGVGILISVNKASGEDHLLSRSARVNKKKRRKPARASDDCIKKYGKAHKKRRHKRRKYKVSEKNEAKNECASAHDEFSCLEAGTPRAINDCEKQAEATKKSNNEPHLITPLQAQESKKESGADDISSINLTVGLGANQSMEITGDKIMMQPALVPAYNTPDGEHPGTPLEGDERGPSLSPCQEISKQSENSQVKLFCQQKYRKMLAQCASGPDPIDLLRKNKNRGSLT
ncbi:hypothetical protein METBIDRAFT_13222 [Metschnikowia bicuspidata var. bicuspidata NRRL YB-4993]|uniref:Uncharacterized protein n=1 Tax=Metschnikowia bicuspidata var. bicuspidata NRRL YB-4993 TaxID=869754 RepID=A0A1A0H5U5_9ASCO|nr:hypothetical protein METBIDRAFT_13222 [Metschnikowia bicuspidata var. bicuspidata NRRL YB-4993]OBA19459.1 hypothetical protein METBIDRAFT_13222 [Metschnikowia bicuspidata var. bicuspidata NRRL YB-4993]